MNAISVLFWSGSFDHDESDEGEQVDTTAIVVSIIVLVAGTMFVWFDLRQRRSMLALIEHVYDRGGSADAAVLAESTRHLGVLSLNMSIGGARFSIGPEPSTVRAQDVESANGAATEAVAASEEVGDATSATASEDETGVIDAG